MVLIIYGIILISFLVFLLLTANYKKSLVRSFPKKEHPFRFLYGCALFVMDKISPVFCRKRGSSDLKQKLDTLNVGKDLSCEELLFRCRRISITLTTFFVLLTLGFLSCISSSGTKDSINTLSRSDTEEEYTLDIVLNEDETQQITVSVDAESFPFDDVIALFEKSREGIVSALLGENTDLMEIRYPLHFITEYGDDGLQILWEVEDEALIDSEGNLLHENIGELGAYTNLKATLTLDTYSASLVIPIYLVP